MSLYDLAVGPPDPHRRPAVYGSRPDEDVANPPQSVAYYRADWHPDRPPIPRADRWGRDRFHRDLWKGWR